MEVGAIQRHTGDCKITRRLDKRAYGRIHTLLYSSQMKLHDDAAATCAFRQRTYLPTENQHTWVGQKTRISSISITTPRLTNGRFDRRHLQAERAHTNLLGSVSLRLGNHPFSRHALSVWAWWYNMVRILSVGR